MGGLQAGEIQPAVPRTWLSKRMMIFAINHLSSVMSPQGALN